MTSTALNRSWMVQTFLTVLAATENGSYTPVNAAYPEIIDLTNRKYVKQNKKLHNDTKLGEVAYVAVKGANAVDLLTDLGYTAADRDELSQIIPSELIDAMTQAQTPATPAQAQTPAAPQVPAAPSVPAAPAVPTATDSAPVAPAAPVLGGETLSQASTPVAATSTAPVADTSTAVQQTLTGVDTGGIDLDVSFGAKPVSNLIDYDSLVKAKKANPASQPSIHIAGKKSKDISVPVKKQAEFYEQQDGITFRVRTVHANDPKGAGVRIFALTVEEAPERRKFGGAK